VFRSAREPSYPVYEPEKFGTTPPFAETLLVLGEREVVFDPVAARSLGNRLFPNITVEMVPDVGHLMTIERPDLVNGRIVQFLGS
jgi:pimeloyl-ACP methyl ester carboxylesterase